MSFKTCLSCIVTSYTELIDVSSGLPNLRIALFSLRISQYFSKKAKIQISHYHSFIGKSKHVMVRLWTIIKVSVLILYAYALEQLTEKRLTHWRINPGAKDNEYLLEKYNSVDK